MLLMPVPRPRVPTRTQGPLWVPQPSPAGPRWTAQSQKPPRLRGAPPAVGAGQGCASTGKQRADTAGPATGPGPPGRCPNQGTGLSGAASQMTTARGQPPFTSPLQPAAHHLSTLEGIWQAPDPFVLPTKSKDQRRLFIAGPSAPMAKQPGDLCVLVSNPGDSHPHGDPASVGTGNTAASPGVRIPRP